MHIPDQICSLELSKRLKELGVKQESLFYRFQGQGYQYIFCKEYEQYSPHVNLDIKDGFSAFTVAELGTLLPAWFDSAKRKDDDYICRYFEKEQDKSYCSFSEKEADARAKLLIYLLENKLMELK